MGKRLYRFLWPFLHAAIPKLTAAWDVPYDGEPCIFVCNHERALGPLEMAINFEMKDTSRIWIYDGPLHRETFRAYVLQDHWWKEDGLLAPVWNVVLPPILGTLVPPILRSVPYIDVYHDGRAMKTMRDSIRCLKNGENVVIFPEIPTEYGEHDTEKINEGFLYLLPMYHKATGSILKIWPIHLDFAGNRLHVKKPIVWDEHRSLQEQVPELSRAILEGIFT